jgi:hypothetical protein
MQTQIQPQPQQPFTTEQLSVLGAPTVQPADVPVPTSSQPAGALVSSQPAANGPIQVPGVIAYDQFVPSALLPVSVTPGVSKADPNIGFKKFNLTYNYNNAGNMQVCDTLFVNLCETTLRGISFKKPTEKDPKTGQMVEKKDAKDEVSVMMIFPLTDPKAQDCADFFENKLRRRLAQLLDDPKVRMDLGIDEDWKSSDEKDVRTTLPMKQYIYHPVDKITKQPIPGAAPSRFFKLLDYENFKTRFTLVDGTELSWDFLKDKKITGYPCIQFTHIFSNALIKASPQIKLYSMIVTDFDEMKPEDRQEEFRQEKFLSTISNNPGALDSLRARIEAMTQKKNEGNDQSNPLTSGIAWKAQSLPTPALPTPALPAAGVQAQTHTGQLSIEAPPLTQSSQPTALPSPQPVTPPSAQPQEQAHPQQPAMPTPTLANAASVVEQQSMPTPTLANAAPFSTQPAPEAAQSFTPSPQQTPQQPFAPSPPQQTPQQPFAPSPQQTPQQSFTPSPPQPFPVASLQDPAQAQMQYPQSGNYAPPPQFNGFAHSAGTYVPPPGMTVQTYAPPPQAYDPALQAAQ